jgi:hypothetical protein
MRGEDGALELRTPRYHVEGFSGGGFEACFDEVAGGVGRGAVDPEAGDVDVAEFRRGNAICAEFGEARFGEGGDVLQERYWRQLERLARGVC